VFTGLISELGKIELVQTKGDGLLLRLLAPKSARTLKEGGSININGVCQTVTKIMTGGFVVFSAPETLKRTNFKYLKNGDQVNLELPLTLNDPLGGHLVTGHVDDTGEIRTLEKTAETAILKVDFDPKYANYLIEKGSITVDGISLTCFDITDSSFCASLIPETLKNSNMQFRTVGDMVNLEFDLFAKYTEKILNSKQGAITMDYLNEHGFEVKYD